MQLLQDLALAFPCETDPHLFVPYVHLFPVEICSHGGSLVLATDLHPRILSTTTVGTTHHDGTVMYIGPDSLALVRNLPLISCGDGPLLKILDLCTGSGVQALAALRKLGDGTSKALCVDINDRALRFVKFNAALNDLERQVHARQTDLIAGEMNGDEEKVSVADVLREACHEMSPNDDSDSRTFNVILANPPFIPVPPDDDTILKRYGLFSSGGPDGEDVLKVVIELASALLPANGGLLGVVSEFMNPPMPGEDRSLMGRLQEWWSTGPGGRGVLFTNGRPVDAGIYSERRADSRKELDTWLRHLAQLNVTHVSPGLLFINTDQSMQEMEFQHRLVPKTKSGSIWTPSNRDAVEFTRKSIDDVLYRSGASL